MSSVKLVPEERRGSYFLVPRGKKTPDGLFNVTDTGIRQKVNGTVWFGIISSTHVGQWHQCGV